MKVKCVRRLYRRRRDRLFCPNKAYAAESPFISIGFPSSPQRSPPRRPWNFLLISTGISNISSANSGGHELYKPATVAQRLAHPALRSRAMCPPLAWRSTTPNDHPQRGEFLAGGGGVRFPSPVSVVLAPRRRTMYLPMYPGHFRA